MWQEVSQKLVGSCNIYIATGWAKSIRFTDDRATTVARRSANEIKAF